MSRQPKCREIGAVFAFILTICVFPSHRVVGQSVTGQISGIVTDSTAAAVPDASIIVVDVDRNATYRTVSNATGMYVVGSLPPGTYRLTAEKAGFRTFQIDSFPLSTQQKATINISLEIGAVTETVQVTGEAQLIDTTSSTLSSVVENKRIVDLPLNGRNVFSLTALVPGVFYTRQLGGPDDSFRANQFSINGGQPGTSEILIDGVTATAGDELSNVTATSAVPSVESIQEFRIQTNAYSAEFGRSGGGIVTLATKSGTNEVHGSLFYFGRNAVLDANSFFANAAGQVRRDFKRHQFGASIGGPVVLPKLYNGQNRSFFYFTYEGMRRLTPSLSQHTVPTELERNGDFSRSLNQFGQMRVIYDPFSVRPDPARPNRYLRDPFPGNRIPANMMDPVALNAQKYYPMPNAPGDLYTGQRNFVRLLTNTEPQDRVETKIDHNLSERRRLFGRFTMMDSDYGKPNVWGNIADPFCCPRMFQRLTNAAFDYTDTLSSYTVFNVRLGLSRAVGNRLPESAGFRPSELGLPASIDAVADFFVFPTISPADYTQMGPNAGDVYLSARTTYNAVANLAKVTGRHSLKFGVDSRFNFVAAGQLQRPSGNFSFARSGTQGPDPIVASDVAGNGYASFLLGVGSGGISHEIRSYTSNRYIAFYVQDDFKVSRKLTINLGYRWEFENALKERYNRLTAVDPLARNPISDAVGMELRGINKFAGSTLGRDRLREMYPWAINPRIGIAYELSPKTSIRTGYGIFFGVPVYSPNYHYIGPFSSSTPMQGFGPDNTVQSRFSNPFPNGFVLPTQETIQAPWRGFGSGWPEAMVPHYNQNWNFTIQRALVRELMLEVAYAGNKGTHLPIVNYAANTLNAQILSLRDQLLQVVPNPFYGIIPAAAGSMAQPTIQYSQLLRPFPQFSGGIYMNPGWGISNFHALQVRLEKRFSRGLSALVAYTWSKTLTTGQDGFWTTPWVDIRDYTCLRCDYSLSSYDQPQRFVANFTWELPFGRGKLYGGNWNRALDSVLGQWQVNGIVTLSHGVPLRFKSNQNTSRALGGAQTPDSTGVNADLGDARTIDRWFDISQFRIPAEYTFGNVSRTHPNLREDGAQHMDFSIFKSFRINERWRIQLRGEAFNLANTPLFSAPNTTLNSNNFGRVTGTQNSPRQIQYALKILF